MPFSHICLNLGIELSAAGGLETTTVGIIDFRTWKLSQILRCDSTPTAADVFAICVQNSLGMFGIYLQIIL